INSGRSADASMEQSLAASAAKSAVAESDAARSEAIAASQAAEHAIASENAAGQHNADSVAADASANASLVASASASSAANSEAQSLINSGRSADASMEQSLAASAAKSAVAESDAARSEAIAASQAAEHAIASENAAGQHYASSVAAEAATNNSLADSALISSAAENVQNALNDVVQDGVRDSKINDLYNHAMAEAQKPTSSDAHETAKTLNNDADQIRNEAKKNYDDKIAAVMKNVDAIYDQARKDGVHADVKKKPYMDIVAEAQNPSEKNAGLEVAKLNDMLQKMVDAINADKASQIDAAAQNVQNALDGAVQDVVRDATINDLYNHAMAEAQKPSATNARETANTLNDYADQIRNEAKKNYDDKIAAVMKNVDAFTIKHARMVFELM
ncbi:hypothetical protein HAU27_08440, partial [Weissella confusa]|nr:hypothetical protein [Weissella confusa]